MYDARQIANWFVNRAKKENRQMSIMQLLKLVYIAHGWHLEMRKSPLIANKIEAWKYGPVIPDVYRAFRSQGVNVTTPVPDHSTEIAPSDAHLLEQIYSLYGNMPALRLSDITHEAGSPWDVATRNSGYFAPISDDLIQAHYEEKRRAYTASSQ